MSRARARFQSRPRQQPVTRAEVRLIGSVGERHIATVPFDACEPRQGECRDSWTYDDKTEEIRPVMRKRTEYHPITKLFEPLMAQLRDERLVGQARVEEEQAQLKERQAQAVAYFVEIGKPHLAPEIYRHAKPPRQLPEPELPHAFYSWSRVVNNWGGRECFNPLHTCKHCRRKYFSWNDGGYCSNRCFNQGAPSRIAARAHQVEQRSAERLEARAGLSCQQCGVLLKAQRSTARYCSGKCRVAALRKRRHNQ